MKYRHFKKSRKLAGVSSFFWGQHEQTAATERHHRHLQSKWGGYYLWRWRSEQWRRGKKEEE